MDGRQASPHLLRLTGRNGLSKAQSRTAARDCGEHLAMGCAAYLGTYQPNFYKMVVLAQGIEP